MAAEDKDLEDKSKEEEADVEEGEGGSDDEEDSSSVVSTASSDASASKKKKKKKKKKKGPKAAASAAVAAESAGGNAGPSASAPALTVAQKKECEKRFNTALEEIKTDSDMWVKLSNCNIFDAKARKLAEVLKSNTSVTSLDLSGNHISDEGAQALAAILTGNGAKELIELDLRDNPLSPAALHAIEGVGKARKQLVVKTGPLQPPEADKAAGAGSGSGKELKDMTKGPMFRKYFQTGDDDEEGGAGHGELEEALGDGGLAPEDLWAEVTSLVAAGTSSIPKLSTLLQQLIGHLNRELGTLQVSQTGGDVAVDGSRPHIKGCVVHLEVLGHILDMVPRQVTMQYVTEAQPAVGSHRVWATEIVSMLLAPNHTAVDNLVAASKLVPRIFLLSLRHPMCSALHTRALRILRSCCVSKVANLYGPLFTAGLGAGLTVQGGEEPCGSLQQQLADVASAALGVPSGRRDPVMGFVLEACKVLRACCDEANRDSILNTNVRRLLLMDSKWSDFVSEGGVLSQLSKEQEGDLGGPRAARAPMDDSADLAELTGGGLSHEILALLQGMGALGGMGGGGGQ